MTRISVRKPRRAQPFLITTILLWILGAGAAALFIRSYITPDLLIWINMWLRGSEIRANMIRLGIRSRLPRGVSGCLTWGHL
jgi:hypothetical protein